MPKRLLLIFVLLCAELVSAGNLPNKCGVIKKDKQTEILTSAISIFSGNGWSQPQGAMLQTNQGENTSALIIDSYKKDLETTENGKVLIKAYNTFGSALLLYTASRLGISAFKISVPIFKSAYKKYTTLKEYLNYKALNPTKAKEFEASIDNLIKCADEAVNGAGRQFSLLAEEALGGHSIARHGPQLTLLEMEQRVLGTHPTIPQSRSALRFETQAIHEDAVNKAFTQYGDEIDAFFANPNNTYKEWTFDYGSKVGSGYTNTGTLSNPVSQAVTSNKVTISIKRVANSPRGYRLESAFPDIR